MSDWMCESVRVYFIVEINKRQVLEVYNPLRLFCCCFQHSLLFVLFEFVFCLSLALSSFICVGIAPHNMNWFLCLYVCVYLNSWVTNYIRMIRFICFFSLSLSFHCFILFIASLHINSVLLGNIAVFFARQSFFFFFFFKRSNPSARINSWSEMTRRIENW